MIVSLILSTDLMKYYSNPYSANVYLFNVDVVRVFVLLIWTYFTTFSSVSIVDFAQVNVIWVFN